MKKVIYFIVLLLFIAPATIQAKSPLTVSITETTPVYKEAQKVAVFNKGTSHTILKESDRYYHTVIGNEEVKFSKKRAKVKKDTPGSLKGAHPVKATTIKRVSILHSPSKQGKEIGQLQPNTTIDLQRAKGDYYPINFGGKTGYIHKNDVHVDAGIPVLMYHDLTKVKTDDNVSVLEISKFEEQMRYLKKNGWTTITTEQLELWLRRQLELPKKSVLITFDDGYESITEFAYPILKQNGFQATSFLITSRIGRPGMVSAESIQATADVFEYQSHTHRFHMFNSLTNLSFLQSESYFAIMMDLKEANDTIEDILGSPYKVTAHAYPYGKYSIDAINALQDVGISIAFTIDEGNVHRGDPIMSLQRQRVHSSMSLTDFANKLNGK
ncbi:MULTISPECIES: polysaccharide deacetylase family protein [Sporosarcina]|uniref:Polysaccharide deacetylase family protein n=1 Tax=Sporosarcina contaminans TaxID=633403 RepID=A0ABW3TWC2_9BACL